MGNIKYEDSIQLKQEGKIGWVELVQQGGYYEEFKEWCNYHNIELTEKNAEFYLEMTENKMMENQMLNQYE